MVTLRMIALVFAASLGSLLACGKGKAESPSAEGKAQEAQGRAALGLGVLGAAALPAETRVVLGVSVTRLAAAPLARRLLGELLGRDVEANQRIGDLLARCRIDPQRDLDFITIGMAQGQDLGLVIRGRLDDKALADCVKAEATGAGGAFADQVIAGRTVHAATSKAGGQKVWFTADPDHTLIVALSEGWMTKLVEPAAPRLESVKETVALLARVSKDAAIWGVGYLPPGVGENLVKLTDGQVRQPAQSVAFEATFDAGLVATLRVDMKSSSDADRLATFVKGQLDWLAVAAQRYGAGAAVAKIEIMTDQASVKLSARLDDADVKTLEAALAKGSAAAGNPNEKIEKKEQSK